MSPEAPTSLWPAVAAVAAAATLVVLAGQWLLLHRQARQQEAQLLYQVEERWVSLRGAFRIAIMTALGPNAAYAEVTSEESKAYTRLQQLREQRDIHQQLYAEQAPDEDEELQDLSFQHQEHIRSVLLYLAFISSLILRGHLSTRGAYEVVGPSLVRRSGALRTLLQNEGPWLGFRPGVEDRVRYLMDSLWAEAAHSGELSSGEVARAAVLKRWTHSGRVARRRLSRLCAGAGTSYIRRISLLARLAWAEVLPRRRRLVSTVGFERFPVYAGWILRRPYTATISRLAKIGLASGMHWASIQTSSDDAYGTRIFTWVTSLSNRPPVAATIRRITGVLRDSEGSIADMHLWSRSSPDRDSHAVVVGDEVLPYLMDRESQLSPGRARIELSLETEDGRVFHRTAFVVLP